MFAKFKVLSMSTKVLYAFAVGIFAGLFFGELLAPLAIAGDAFIKLLQMTVIPYIVVSLISSVGKLSHEQAKAVGLQVGKLVVLIWALGILLIFSVKWIFPSWQAGDFFSLTALESPQSTPLMDLYIPANPFSALANAYIPAIVLFCIFTGIALIGIENKERILVPLGLLADTFNKVTGYILKLMPLGIFAMTASAAGTLDFAEFQKLQVYFLAHVVMTLLLTYWLLPAIVASITPFSYKDISGIAKDAFITAFASGNIFIVLPILIEHSKELFHKYNLGDDKTDDYTNIIVPIVFSLPNLGKLLTLVFVLFAAWFSGENIDFWSYLAAAINGLFSLFGSVYLTIPMLLDSLELNTDLFQLYVVSSLFTSRFMSLLAAMNIFVLAVAGTALLANKAELNVKRCFFYMGLTPLFFALTLGFSALLLKGVINTEYVMDEVLVHMTQAEELPDYVNDYKFDALSAPKPLRNIAAIKKSGVLRVGFNHKQVPFSFINANNELVGFDIDMMRKLAQELKVKLSFIPYNNTHATLALNKGQYDIVISGLQMTTERIQRANFSNPVLELHYSLVVQDHRLNDLSNAELLAKAGPLRVATVGDYTIIPMLQKRFPNIEIENIKSDSEFFKDNGQTWDALLISLEAGKAWTILYPDYTTLYYRDDIHSFPAAYAVAKNNLSLHTFLNSWLTIQTSSGYVDTLYEYWILGQNAQPKTSRWSVVKDVLHWLE